MARSGISPGPGAWLPALGTVALTCGVRPDTLMSHGDGAPRSRPGRTPVPARAQPGRRPDARPRMGASLPRLGPQLATAPAGPMACPGPAGQPRAAVTHEARAGHVGAYRMLRFAVPGAGRYPYLTSMSISMPAVPRSEWGRVAAGAADSLAAGLAQGAGPEQVPQMKAYDCAHIQPQGR